MKMNSFQYKIACIIVTYNRKELLLRCLNAIKQQSYKPKTVYIVDNASTDGTDTVLRTSGYINQNIQGVYYKYIKCDKNTGGAGGFHIGMKTAFQEEHFDGLWVMDDDGEPDINCLKELVSFLETRDYIAPIVLSDIDKTTCSFIPHTTYIDFCKKADANGVVNGWASPFNGILYSHRLIKKIGFPKKEMFIWGDEINYQLRAEKAGFHRMTSIKAIHYHPLDRQVSLCNKDTLNVTIIPIETDWKLYCAIRNKIYNLHLMYGWYKSFKKAYELFKAYKHYYRIKGTNKDNIIFNAFIAGYLGYFKKIDKLLKNK